MDSKLLSTLICFSSISIVDAMEKIDKNTKGILFVINDNGELIGSLSDGDIRRWLIKTGNMTAKIFKCMNVNPKFIFDTEIDKSKKYMKNYNINAIPVVDSKRKIKDILFLEEDEYTTLKNEFMLKNIPVIIMAGGKGTRLYPFTKILPKPLIPIGEIPIIERIINKFCKYGVSNFYLTVNYKKAMIKSYFSDFEHDYSINYVEENKPLGTAGSIKLISEEFKTPVIITNCDTLIETNYSKLIDYHISSKNDLTIVAALKNIIIPYGVIHSEKNGIITSMQEKPKLNYFINTGFYVMNPKFISKIPDGEMFHMTDLANLLLDEGFKVGMYPISEDNFLDMGEFEEMKRMESKLNIS